MGKYHLFKETRLYEGLPYSGFTSDGHIMAFDTLEDARLAKILLNKINPVGWDIYFEGEQVV